MRFGFPPLSRIHSIDVVLPETLGTSGSQAEGLAEVRPTRLSGSHVFEIETAKGYQYDMERTPTNAFIKARFAMEGREL